MSRDTGILIVILTIIALIAVAGREKPKPGDDDNGYKPRTVALNPHTNLRLRCYQLSAERINDEGHDYSEHSRTVSVFDLTGSLGRTLAIEATTATITPALLDCYTEEGK